MSNKLFISLLLIFSFAFLVSQNKTDSTRIVSALKVNTPTPQVFITPTSLPTYAPGIIYAKRVIDGDTIEISTGEIVRYIGINTPEMSGKNKLIQCFAVEAFQANKALVEGKVVTLEKDISDKDKYGRLLRYVYVADPSFAVVDGQTPKQIFVNDYLVKNGYAQVATYPPDVNYQKMFLSSQKEAKSKLAGLWSSCKKNP